MKRQAPKQARIITYLAYNAIIQAMKSRGFHSGVAVNQVNPVYTSLIGRCKFAEKYGLSIHEAAAMTIARRFLGVSERLPRNLDKVPNGKGGHVTLSLPARNRDQHVWTSWRKIHRETSSGPDRAIPGDKTSVLRPTSSVVKGRSRYL